MFGLWKMEFKAWSLKDGIQSLIQYVKDGIQSSIIVGWNLKFVLCKTEFKARSLKDGILSSKVFQKFAYKSESHLG